MDTLQRQNNKLRAQMSELRQRTAQGGAAQEDLIARAMSTEKQALDAEAAVEKERRVIEALPDGPDKETAQAVLKQKEESAAAKAHAVVRLKQSALFAEPKKS